MDANVRRVGIARAKAKTYYERWLEKEGVPIVEGFGVTDVRKINLGTWRRLGCEGAYLQFRGLEGITGVYIGKIAPGAADSVSRRAGAQLLRSCRGEGRRGVPATVREPALRR